MKSIGFHCFEKFLGSNLWINSLKKTWNVNFLIAGNSTNAGGVLIVLNNNFEYIIHNKILDKDGRFIVLDIELPDVARFLLINLYAPNNDTPDFYKNLATIVESSNIRNVIFTGDWNLVLDPALDTFNYIHINNPKSTKEVKTIIEKFELIYIWRHTHPDQKFFSWRQGKF